MTTAQLIHSIEPLLRVTLAQAERHGLDEIRISKARARTILTDLTIAKKTLERPARPEPSYFRHLDRVMA